MNETRMQMIEPEIKLSEEIPHPYKPFEAVIKVLRNKAIYLQTNLDTNADGSPRAREIDAYARLETALSRETGWNGDGKFVDSEQIPFIALPGKFNLVSGVGCRLGDLALVRCGRAEVFAIYADVGPVGKIGEGSIALVEALGVNPWNRSKTKIVCGIEAKVETLVFPRSSEKYGIPKTFNEIQAVGQAAFDSFFSEAGHQQALSVKVSEIQ